MSKLDELFKSAETNTEDALHLIHILFIYFVLEFKLPLKAISHRIKLSHTTLYKYIKREETPSVRCAERLMSFITELIGLRKAFLKIIEVGDFSKPGMNQYMKAVYKSWGISIARAEFHTILHSDLPAEERARMMIRDLIVMNLEAHKGRKIIEELKSRVNGIKNGCRKEKEK